MLDETRLAAAVENVPASEIPRRVANLVAEWIERKLADVTEDARSEFAIEVSQRILKELKEESEKSAVDDNDELVPPLRQLDAIETRDPTRKIVHIQRPLTPLADTVLLTNARGEPSVGAELKAEIDSADRIDLVLNFSFGISGC